MLNFARVKKEIPKIMPTIAINKRAGFDYVLGEHYEAGLVLTGAEVKSVKTGHASLKGSFVTVRGSELYLTNTLIPRYSQAHRDTEHDNSRPRKLLLRKREIRSLIGKFRTESLTLVPIRLYTRKQLVKLEFAVGKGKKTYDKRAAIAKRETKRKIERTLKNKFSIHNF
jgi:SsrA-binding protein